MALAAAAVSTAAAAPEQKPTADRDAGTNLQRSPLLARQPGQWSVLVRDAA